jgi:hypothetical protein
VAANADELLRDKTLRREPARPEARRAPSGEARREFENAGGRVAAIESEIVRRRTRTDFAAYAALRSRQRAERDLRTERSREALRRGVAARRRDGARARGTAAFPPTSLESVGRG